MKHSFAKLCCLMLAVLLALTGCNLIKIDGVMQAHENLEKARKSYETVIAEYEGGSRNIFDVTNSLNANYSYMSQLRYYFYGSSSLSSEDISSLYQDVLESAVTNDVINIHAPEIGVELTAEEIQECETDAKETWEKYLNQAIEQQATGDTPEEKAADAEYQLYLQGISEDMLLYETKLSKVMGKVEETLRGAVTDVSEEEIQDTYMTRVQEKIDAYTEDIDAFATDMTQSSSVAYWIPEGYRVVKHILVIPETEVMDAYKEAYTALNDLRSQIANLEDEYAAATDDDTAADEETAEEETAEEETTRTAEEIKADLETRQAELPAAEEALKAASENCFANVQDKLDEINARIAAGDDFAELIAEYGEDPGMKNEPTASRGYYVCAENQKWDSAFRDAAMALESIGDISEPILGQSGIHIIRYESDAIPGAADLETLHDSLYDELLESKKTAYYQDTVNGWVEAANPQYYYDKWTYSEE